jgi:catechol 2,3-dioxygenase-like lactoylglutathione lyase family enzyme
MLTSVDHCVIAVRDLDSAAETYAKLLGRAVSWRGTHPELGTANALFQLENSYVELLCPVGDGELADPLWARLERHGEGFAALAFGTDDAEACAAMLRSRDVSVAGPAPGAGIEAGSQARREWQSIHLPLEETRGVPIFVVEHRSPAEMLPAAPLQSPEDTVVSAVDHVVIMTGDADACRELYGARLGLRLALDRAFEKRGIRLLFFRVGGLTVECAAPLDRSTSSDRGDRLWGISYRVPDVSAARERVAAAGFDVSEVRGGHKPGTRVCTVRHDTCGVATLFISSQAE